MNCDPASLAAAASCLCFHGQTNDCVRSFLLCQWQLALSSCVENPTDAIPVLTPSYVGGVLTGVDYLLPVVYDTAGDVQLYGAYAADMSGAELVSTEEIVADMACTPDLTGSFPYPVPAGYPFYAARQISGDGIPVSGWSNVLPGTQ